jgi:hypothetical protein
MFFLFVNLSLPNCGNNSFTCQFPVSAYPHSVQTREQVGGEDNKVNPVNTKFRGILFKEGTRVLIKMQLKGGTILYSLSREEYSLVQSRVLLN